MCVSIQVNAVQVTNYHFFQTKLLAILCETHFILFFFIFYIGAGWASTDVKKKKKKKKYVYVFDPSPG